MEAVRRGSSYYDYENNVNVVPAYTCGHLEMGAIMSARGRSDAASTARCSPP